MPIRNINVIPDSINLSEKFRIRTVQEVQTEQKLIQDTHRHDYYFILALIKGKGKHTIDFIKYEVTDYSIFFMRPGQVHQLSLEKGCTGFLMQFSKDFYRPGNKTDQQLLRSASNKNFCKLDLKKSKNLFNVLSYIYKEYIEKEKMYFDIIKANLSIFFVELTRYRENQIKPENKNTMFTHERLDEFLELLENNISKNKQVSEYANMLNLSTFQLNSMTKSNLGKTCSTLIDQQIILEAKRYLLATTEQVKEIAYNLGYEDVSYFIRFFKKHTGQTPEVYRTNFT
ncbi:MAG: helix-turn-helix transcriptional regulator [Ignavibacteriales bacterium]|nr:helix-turn-helix transcriptional regulator [Ignavibacteriales bacterium]